MKFTMTLAGKAEAMVRAIMDERGVGEQEAIRSILWELSDVQRRLQASEDARRSLETSIVEASIGKPDVWRRLETSGDVRGSLETSGGERETFKEEIEAPVSAFASASPRPSLLGTEETKETLPTRGGRAEAALAEIERQQLDAKGSAPTVGGASEQRAERSGHRGDAGAPAPASLSPEGLARPERIRATEASYAEQRGLDPPQVAGGGSASDPPRSPARAFDLSCGNDGPRICPHCHHHPGWIDEICVAGSTGLPCDCGCHVAWQHAHRPSCRCPDCKPRRRRKPQPKAAGPRFEAFFAAYPSGPRKVRKTAEEAYLRAESAGGLPPLNADESDPLVLAVAWWKLQHDWTRDGGTAICAPAVWLNQRRWEPALEALSRRPEFMVEDPDTARVMAMLNPPLPPPGLDALARLRWRVQHQRSDATRFRLELQERLQRLPAGPDRSRLVLAASRVNDSDLEQLVALAREGCPEMIGEGRADG